ncbi:MAG: TIM44-like domain-containing protein [Chitinophagaceae bacterium]
MKLKFYSVIFCLINSILLFARGGGSSSSSSGKGGFNPLSLAYILIAVAFYFMVRIRRKQAKKVIEESSDPSWDIDYLKTLTEKIFFDFQDAWMKKDLTLIQSRVTYNFYCFQQPKINELVNKKQTNKLDLIFIHSIDIVSSKDYKNDNLDSFSAIIKGKMIDYIISDRSYEVIFGNSKKQEPFTDYYLFIRNNNTWLLNKVVNEPELSYILDAKSYKEV